MRNTGLAKLATVLLALVAVAALPLPARAQIGAEPIRIVFPFAAGGSGDALARLAVKAGEGADN